MIKKALFLALYLVIIANAFIHAQTTVNTVPFHGALATKTRYQVVYQLNSDEDAHIKATLKNIRNALSDSRLINKLDVELVVHGKGLAAFKIGSPYEELLRQLKQQKVILAMCENTMRERDIKREDLYSFVSYVPSGNGELIIRQQEGWAYIHP
ncbi:DsrE family protein [Telluribacter humicola]|uniref:DsrE family protein n=1 Tax=Telluribacter humicola TaxID=1720261 RepID=UPI001A95A739|nr:DsrE family protein [Telluribacter humicola]